MFWWVSPFAWCHSCTALGASMLPAPAFVPDLHPPLRRLCCGPAVTPRARTQTPRSRRALLRRATPKTPFSPPRECFTHVFPTFPFSGMWETRSSPLRKRAGITRPIPHIRHQGSPANLGESVRQTPRSQPRAWCAPGGVKTLFAPFRNPFATGAQQTRVG